MGQDEKPEYWEGPQVPADGEALRAGGGFCY